MSELNNSSPEHTPNSSPSTIPTNDPPKQPPPLIASENAEKLRPRHIFLLLEMTVLTLSVMFIEIMLVPALPMIIKRFLLTTSLRN